VKRPQPNLERLAVNNFIASSGFNKKFKRLWKTETIGGVEVLRGRVYHYKRGQEFSDQEKEDNEKLFKFLGVNESLEDFSSDGVDSAWFTLNKSNAPEELDIDDTFVSTNLNKVWWDTNDGPMPPDLTLTTTLIIGSPLPNAVNSNLIDYSKSKEEVIDIVQNNYDTIWDSYEVIQEGVGVINKGTIVDEEYNTEIPDEDDLSPNDPWLGILARHALRHPELGCVVKDVEVGLIVKPGYVKNTLVVTIEIPYGTYTPSSSVCREVYNALTSSSSWNRGTSSTSSFYKNTPKFFNDYKTKELAKKITFYSDVVSETDMITRDYVTWQEYNNDGTGYGMLWHEHENVYYLKADVIENPSLYGLKQPQLRKYLNSLLDTGYKKKSVPWYKKVIAVIVFVVSVVVSYISAGATSGWTAAAYAAAQAIVIGSLVVTLAALVSSALGASDLTSAFAWVSAEIEPLVTIATIIIIIDVVSNVSDKIAEKGLDEFATDYVNDTINSILDGIVQGFQDIVSGTISIESISVTTRALKLHTDNQLNKIESINDRNKDLRAEYKDLQKEIEQEQDVLKGFMNIYAKPATADWSMYTATYDLPYERSGGSLALGNVQITTKQALRSSDT